MKNFLEIMSKSWVALVPFLLMIYCQQTLALPTTYTVIDLGSNLSNTQYTAINDQGMLLGRVRSPGSDYQGFIDYQGSRTLLGTLNAGNSFPLAMNNRGDVVGYASVITQNGAVTNHGFLYRNGAIQDLEPGSFYGSSATGINDSGTITGWSRKVGNGLEHAFKFDGTTFVDLDGSIFSRSFAYAINNSGHIVGDRQRSNPPYPMFIHRGQGMIDISSSLGFVSLHADDVNDSDHIVGYARGQTGWEQAYFYNGSTMQLLGTFGGLNSVANAINNSDQVVGGASTNPQTGTQHAFLWEDNQLYDLNGLIADNMSWGLTTAIDINNRGEILAHNSDRWLLLQPVGFTDSQAVPEPGTLAILALGLAGMGIRRCKRNEGEPCQTAAKSCNS